MKMKKSIKRMVLTIAAVTVMMSLAAPAAMAQEEVQVPDHPNGGSNGNSSTVAEEPLKDDGIKLSDITPTEGQEEEDRIKDPGIKLSDITPTDGQEEDTADGDSGTHDPGSPVEGEEDRIKDSGIKLSDITSTDGQEEDTDDDSQDDNNNKKNEHTNDQDEYPEYCNLPMLVYDPACDQNNQGHSENAEEDSSQNRDGGDSSSSSTNSDEVGQLASGSGQIANSEANNSSPTTTGCPFDYEYQEDVDTCFPSEKDLGFFSVVTGTEPWPDSFGGYVALPGHFVGDIPKMTGALVQALLGHHVGDNLVGYGEDVGGLPGYGLQGLGYTISTVADMAGGFLEASGHVVGAVNDGVGTAVDTVVDNVVTPVLGGVVGGVEAVVESVEAVADVAKSTWNKISSWF